MDQWILQTDRQRERAAAGLLLAEGGCLVLHGGVQSGQAQAARLATELAEDAGHSVFAISLVKKRTSLKGLLLGIWEMASDPPEMDEVPRWLAPGPRLPLEVVVEEVAKVLAGSGGPPLLIFETPDRYDPLQDFEIEALSHLATISDSPILITSYTSSGTSWKGLKTMRLADFSAVEIMAALMNSPQIKGRKLEELTLARDIVTDGAAVIPPDVAYARLHAWTKS